MRNVDPLYALDYRNGIWIWKPGADDAHVAINASKEPYVVRHTDHRFSVIHACTAYRIPACPGGVGAFFSSPAHGLSRRLGYGGIQRLHGQKFPAAFTLHRLFFPRKLFSVFLSAPLALATLSLSAGIFALGLLGRILETDTAGTRQSWIFPAVTCALFGLSYPFLLQATVQEVYLVQLAFLLPALGFALRPGAKTAWLSGVFFGVAFACHSGTILLAPAVLAALLYDKNARGLRFALGMAGFTFTVLLLIFVIYSILPEPEQGGKLAYTTEYLRGIALDAPRTALPWWLSAGRFVMRLLYDGPTDFDAGQFSLGLNVLYLVAATGGFALALWRKRMRLLLVFGLWGLPLALYEILVLGNYVDYGATLTYIMLPLTVFAAFAIAGLAARVARKFPGLHPALPAAALTIILLAPGMMHGFEYIQTLPDRRARHFSTNRLLYVWSTEHLPENALVVQPAGEPGPHTMFYYLKQRRLIRGGAGFGVLSSVQAFSPVLMHPHILVTPERLRQALAGNIPVFALEADAFRNTELETVIGGSACWVEAARPDLSELRHRFLPGMNAEAATPAVIYRLQSPCR